jgi:hypothetical protein
MQHYIPEDQTTFMIFLTVFGMEQLSGWKESIILIVYNNDNKTDSSNYAGMSVLSTTYRTFPSILLSSLTPYADEIN